MKTILSEAIADIPAGTDSSSCTSSQTLCMSAPSFHHSYYRSFKWRYRRFFFV